MSNLKKILALVLALVMSFSLVTVSSAAFADEDQIDETYAEAVEVLSGMGIFKGDNGNFKPKAPITRQEVAAMMYRVISTDTADTYDGLYVEACKFDDGVANWAKGFVGYCANGGYIKGVGNNKFDPNGNISGIAVLAMALRAVGYDKNDEFTGPNWDKTVLSVATSLGILENVDESVVSLGLPASRELVAELIFRTMVKAQKVTYTPAFGYQTGNYNFTDNKTTIGWDNFGLTYTDTTSIDNWGRPGYYWYGESGHFEGLDDYDAVYAVIEEEAKATYTTAVTECDVAHDTGKTTNKTYVLYVNGQIPSTTNGSYTIQPLDTVTYIGAQGRLTEVYASGRIVMIDTFLARVTKITDATYDAAGHRRTDSRIDLTVYDQAGATAVTTGTSYFLTNKGTNYTEYAVGDYVLLNAYTLRAGISETASTTVVTANNTTTGDVKYGKILGLAPSMTGAQTIIWYQADQHTVEGTLYADNAKFNLDQAGVEVTDHVWYFDNNNNLIGATDIATVYSYGAIKNIWWAGDATTGAGVAMATLVYMDGTTNVVTLSDITVNTAAVGSAGVYVSAIPTYSIVNSDIMTLAGTTDAYGYDRIRVATNAATNAWAETESATPGTNNVANATHAVLGGHLFRFQTLANGAVSAVEVAQSADATVTGRNSVNTTVTTGVALVNAGAALYINEETKFLVYSPTYGTYTAYTGYTTIPSFVASDVDFVNLDTDAYAELVFIPQDATNTITSNLFYLTDSQYSVVRDVDGVTVNFYVFNGFIDGVAGSIYVPNTTANFTNIVTPLVTAGKDTMWVVTTTAGYVTALQNTGAAISTAFDLDTMSPANVAYTGLNVVAITGNATWTNNAWTGGTHNTNGVVYFDGTNYFNIAGNTPVYGEWATDMSSKNVVLVYKDDLTVVAAYIVDKAVNAIGSTTPAGTTYTVTYGAKSYNAAASNYSVVMTAPVATTAADTVTAVIKNSAGVEVGTYVANLGAVGADTAQTVTFAGVSIGTGDTYTITFTYTIAAVGAGNTISSAPISFAY